MRLHPTSVSIVVAALGLVGHMVPAQDTAQGARKQPSPSTATGGAGGAERRVDTSSSATRANAASVQTPATGQLAPRYPITGVVRPPDVVGSTVATVDSVVARSLDVNPPVRMRVFTDTSGRFSFVSLPQGWYSLNVHYAARRTYSERARVDSALRMEIQLPTTPEDAFGSWSEVVVVVLFLLAYLISVFATRWHHIAKSLRAMLDRQLLALETRLETEVSASSNEERHRIQLLRDRARALRDASSPKASSWWRRGSALGEFLFWSRGSENAHWVAMHEIERLLAAYLAPPEQVRSYLVWAEAELRALTRPVASTMADAIHASLLSPEPTDAGARADLASGQKALLGRAIAIIYDARDTSFSTLMEWQNKASWLLFVALLLVAFLTLAAGHGVLFLAGAAGGFLSRLMRALRREDVPLDYGASWTTLFLSPVFGALVGWFGMALIALATQPRIDLLGEAFRVIRWGDPYSAPTLAVAFLLGFSERFFDAVVGAVERHADRASVTGAAPRAAVAPPAAATPGPPPGGAADRSNGPPPPPHGDGGGPLITKVEPRLRAAGNPSDALLVTGTGFDWKATGRINGADRTLSVQSASTALLALGDDDVARINVGGDSIVVVMNPDGAVSTPYKYP